MLDVVRLLEQQVEYEKWENVPDEDLWHDGELDAEQVMNHIYEHVIVKGDWKLMRSKL